MTTAQISEAKNPGYFTYYKAPEHIVKQEHAGDLQQKIGAVTAMQGDLAAARQDLDAAREAARQQKIDTNTAPQSASNSLAGWFEVSSGQRCLGWGRCVVSCADPNPQILQTYGRPEASAGGDGYRTEFKSSSKLHGGTKHYSAFKSASTTMHVGRMMK